MDRETYLAELRTQLSGRTTAAELERIMAYYKLYFDEGGPDRAGEIIAELGNPAELAARITGNAPPSPPCQKTQPPAPPPPGRGWPLIAALFLVPLFLLLAGILGVVAVAVFLGFAAGGMAAGWSGVLIMGSGVSVIFQQGLATTMLCGGQGLMAMGAGLLLILLGLVLGRLCLTGAAALGGLALRGGRRKQV